MEGRYRKPVEGLLIINLLLLAKLRKTRLYVPGGTLAGTTATSVASVALGAMVAAGKARPGGSSVGTGWIWIGCLTSGQ